MIELHERLSEFSYGYGVTREVEKLLESVGIRAVPYMPSLIEEKKVGFDVAFNKPGVPLLLQFKLGQALNRFIRTDKTFPAPPLTRPFWRFSIDTSEPDGQFETLLKAERDGAEVYYSAPRFSDWPYYAKFFEAEAVLENSVLARPSEIRAKLDASGAKDGFHRVVYDNYSKYVCSEPMRLPDITPAAMASRIGQRLESERHSLGQVLEALFVGFEHRSEIRRRADASPVDTPPPDIPPSDNPPAVFQEVPGRATLQFTNEQRTQRFELLLGRMPSREHAIAAAVGMELWTLGIQMILAVKAEP